MTYDSDSEQTSKYGHAVCENFAPCSILSGRRKNSILKMTISRMRQFLRPIVTLVVRRNICVLQRYTPSNTLLGITGRIDTHANQLRCLSNSTISWSASSSGDKQDMNVTYNDVVEAQKDDKVLIIDVREQFEIDETGKLPGSIHIPMADVSNVLSTLSEDTFKEKYGRDKPSKDMKIILSCRSGKRSGMVQEMMQTMGYKSAYNYTGGYLDWEKNQKV